jgi:bacillolysin
MRTHRRFVTIAMLIAMLLTAAGASAAPRALPAGPAGFRAWTGAQARGFSLPTDVRVAWQATNGRLGLTQTRYQQYVGGAEVLGGQITLLAQAGQQVAVIGSHYPGLVPSNTVKLTPANARGVAERAIGASGRWIVKLAIDPSNGRQFYKVENQRFDSRWFFWIDAAGGKQLNKYNAIHTGTGTGVRGDTKPVDSTFSGGVFQMVSSDNRRATYDAGNAQQQSALPGTLFTNANDTWNASRHPAAVDAHYYADVTDDYYFITFGRNSLDNNGMQIVSSVHFKRRYNNAFWNGSQVTYGDGDGTGFLAFSGAVDVVAHELTHGVTDFTSGLIYQNESGALNESFSDIIGNTVEWKADARDPGTPDWLVAEDISLEADAAPGFRNMGDPQEDADPDHYSERYTGTEDDGGVHTNSAISNHAYYLLVNGGKNAGCDTIGSDGHQHTQDCNVTVAGLGLDTAADIFYHGFTSLPENATIANARFATVAAAASIYGATAEASTNAAWQAVGVGSEAPPPPPPPCTVTATSLPFESAHPYENNFTCTWVYNNGTPNFRFHFDILDLEAGFDYVDILDANDNVVETVSASYKRGYTSKSVSTSVGKVRLRTDPLITKRGFRVDAIVQP